MKISKPRERRYPTSADIPLLHTTNGVRLAIVALVRSIQTFIISNGYTSVEQYVSETGMNRTSVWGTEIEILTLAHLLSTPVLVYAAGNNDWVRYSPSKYDNKWYA